MCAIITRHGENDFSLTLTENPHNINDGWSIRGSWDEIYDELVKTSEIMNLTFI